MEEKCTEVIVGSENEVSEAQNVESEWNAVKEMWLNAAEKACGWTKGPLMHL